MVLSLKTCKISFFLGLNLNKSGSNMILNILPEKMLQSTKLGILVSLDAAEMEKPVPGGK